MWWVWLGACDSRPEVVGTTPADPGPAVVAGPTLSDPGPTVRFAAELAVATDVPTTLEVRISGDGGEGGGRTIRFPGAATEHRVPLLGFLADAVHTVSVRLTDRDGRAVEPEPMSFEVGPAPEDLPEVDLRVADPARMEPGFTLMPARSGETAWILALDPDANVVHAQRTSPRINAVTPTPGGDLVMIDGRAVRQVDWLGRTVRRWIGEPTEPSDVAVSVEDFHHDVVPRPDGSIFALAWSHADVPEYPTSYAAPFVYAPATIRNDLVVHLAADGTELGRWDMLSLLDPRHIGFDALEPDPSGALDWVHANALQYDEATDDLVVSLRHQDAVVRFSAQTGELRWILGAAAGWGAALQPFVLTPTEPFVFHTHQHAVELDDDGVVRMFDNGNDFRNTPYLRSGEREGYSRILELRVDPEAMTVTPVGEYLETSSGRLYSGALGNADRLPATDNRLATYGTLPRIVEWAPDGEVVFDLALPTSWRVDRALRVSSLYGPDVVETRE